LLQGIHINRAGFNIALGIGFEKIAITDGIVMGQGREIFFNGDKSFRAITQIRLTRIEPYRQYAVKSVYAEINNAANYKEV
jgi:hypothetical protein